MAEERWITVASAAGLADGEVLGVEVEGRQIAVYHGDGKFYATDNVCTHAFALLSDGWFDGEVIECPLHAGQFDVRSGKALGPPVDCDIKTYKVRTVGDDVQVLIE